jgi:hypothetical protein
MKSFELYLENVPRGDGSAQAWTALAAARFRQNDILGSVHAEVEMAQLTEIPFEVLSNTANRFNLLLKDQAIEVDREEKRVLAVRLLSAMEKRIDEADDYDLSRMAWLALHLKDEQKARLLASRGLAIDSSNSHCIRIIDRLDHSRW